MNTDNMTLDHKTDVVLDASIIVPAYNAESCIDQCASSLIDITGANVEILLVDDGSTDATADICDELSQRDQRIRVIHQRNQGVSAARNTGLRYARGTWIGFVDADDRVDARAYERVIHTAVGSSADLIMFGYQTVHIDRSSSSWNMPNGDLTIQAAIAMMASYSGSKGYLWNKLYKRSVIARYSIQCDEHILMCEDLLFNIAYVVHCSRIVGIDECAYEYIENASSALHDVDMNKAYTCLAAHKQMLALVPPESRNEIGASCAIMAEEFLMRTYRTGHHDHRHEYRDALCSHWRDALSYDLPASVRIRLLAGRFAPGVFYPTWNLLRGVTRS